MKVFIHRHLSHLLTRRFLLPARAVRPQTPLCSLDLSEHERNELYYDIERHFRLSLDDRELLRVRTLHDLAGCVRRALRPAPALLPALAPAA